MSTLAAKRCKPCEGGVEPLGPEAVGELLKSLPGWAVSESAREISRLFEFKDFLSAVSFANAVAWIAEQEGHHPDLELGWGRCRVRYSTHSIGGLSENDFICAAKVDALVEPQPDSACSL